MTYYTQPAFKSGGIRKFPLLALLLRADRAYRDRQHLLSLSDESLRDVGLTRADLEKL